MARQSRNVGLDAIRLAAAGLVFASHAALASGVSPSLAIVNSGSTGVALFFVLSGYLIPAVWAGQPDRTYWLRRLTRILPAYWLAVIGLGLATGVPVTADVLTMTQPLDVTSFDTFLGVAWTLRIEVVFYALVPVLALLPLRWVVAIAGSSFAVWAVASVGGDLQTAAAAPLRFWMFLPGLVLARRPARAALPWSVAALGAAVIVLATIGANLLLATIGAWLLVASALSRPWRVPRFIIYGSTISYGIYLWHHEILRGLRDLGLSPAMIVGGGLVLTIAAAAASWQLLEQPVNRWAAKGYPLRSYPETPISPSPAIERLVPALAPPTRKSAESRRSAPYQS